VDELARASSAPDRVRDIRIDLPGLDASWDVLGHNASALLHSCRPDGHGWCLYDDVSVPHVASALVSGAAVTWDPAPDGERSPGLAPHPEQVALDRGATLGRHVFTSAVVMLRYFVAEARAAWAAGDLSRWRVCLGFALHYLADLHVPHHQWCLLFYGHQPWEDAAEAEWRTHVGMLALAEPGLLAEEVKRRYQPRADLEAILAALPKWGAARHVEAPRSLQAVDVSLNVLAAGLALMPLMVA
jgi:hypothetical protein